jgi:hypothetical protein
MITGMRNIMDQQSTAVEKVHYRGRYNGNRYHRKRYRRYSYGGYPYANEGYYSPYNSYQSYYYGAPAVGLGLGVYGGGLGYGGGWRDGGGWGHGGRQFRRR